MNKLISQGNTFAGVSFQETCRVPPANCFCSCKEQNDKGYSER